MNDTTVSKKKIFWILVITLIIVVTLILNTNKPAIYRYVADSEQGEFHCVNLAKRSRLEQDLSADCLEFTDNYRYKLAALYIRLTGAPKEN